MDEVRYLIAEHRESNGQPENHLNLQFAGTRQRVASWLSAPAPMGSLGFITPNAAVAVAVLSKEPRDIANDIMTMTEPDKNAENEKWSEAEAKLQINFRDDLASSLGGEFLLSLDGPVLPTPSWKAVIEVHNSERLEQTIERLTESIRNLNQSKGSHVVAIESSEAGGQRFYSVHDLTSGNVLAQYTFSDGYMIVAPSRAILMQALQTQASGDSLARAAAFKALLPKDGTSLQFQRRVGAGSQSACRGCQTDSDLRVGKRKPHRSGKRQPFVWIRSVYPWSYDRFREQACNRERKRVTWASSI
jgi:hypothetical protein